MDLFKPVRILRSQLSTFPIKAGQIIYLTDQFGTYIDVSDGERVPIEQIKQLTEMERQNLLAPVVGFYYETDTHTLWHYDGGWNSFELRPVYSDVSTLETLKSGEKLSVALAKIKYAMTSLINHMGDISNPHKTSKSQIGLSNVENKSSNTIRNEITKTNVTDALGYMPPEQDTTYGIASTDTAGLIKDGGDITVDETGLVFVNDDSHNHVIANVDGLQAALDGKAPSSHAHTKSQISDFPISMPASDVKAWAKAENKPAYTPTEVGVIDTAPTSGQVAIFDGTTGKVKSTGYTLGASVPAGAKFTDTVYTHPSASAFASGLYKITTNNLGHITAAAAVTKADITALGIPAQDTNTTYSSFKGATAEADGASGLVNAPAKGTSNRYLRSDGTWSVPPDTNTTYGLATASANGLLSSGDFAKLSKFSAAEAGYLTGVTSSIQTQLNGKAAASHGTHVTYGTSTTALSSGGTGAVGTAATLARSDHTHTLPAYPTALKNPTVLTLQFNGTTNQTYDGSAAKTLNITPAAIGAAATSHTQAASTITPDTTHRFVSVGTTAPSNTNTIWIDTSTAGKGAMKYHNGTAWVTVPAVWG